jgi:hypothetical protein
LGDDLQQSGGTTMTAGLLGDTNPEVVGVPGVVADVLIPLLEVQQVHPTPRGMPVPLRPLACRRWGTGRDLARDG